MSQDSAIEWTDDTWNPVAGCSLVSPGCTNCYAMKMAHRLEKMGQAKYTGTTEKRNGRAVWTGKITLDEKALQIPLKKKKPTRYFVNSMSDLFHEGVPDSFIDKVFAVMALCPQHTLQVLTKRPERMAAYVGEGEKLRNRIWGALARILNGTLLKQTEILWPLPNVWLGVSVEDQARANERLPYLRKTPAAVRFVSYEPALGCVNFEHALKCPGCPDCGFSGCAGSPIHWVIVGGESGTGARPFNIGWARAAVNQCKAAGVAVFVKQVGAKPHDGGFKCEWGGGKGNDMAQWPSELRVREFPRVENGVPY